MGGILELHIAYHGEIYGIKDIPPEAALELANIIIFASVIKNAKLRDRAKILINNVDQYLTNTEIEGFVNFEENENKFEINKKNRLIKIE